MSVRTIVLYGNRLYRKETYSTNQDPQSLTATLTDSATLSDSEVQKPIKALSESVVSSDSRIISIGIKALTDASTLGEVLTFIQKSIRLMSDSLVVADNKASIHQTKGLSDFILVKDWIELRWSKANVWAITPTFGFRPSHIHNYGSAVRYGVDFYSSNPSVNWLPFTPDTATWIMTAQTIKALPLYAKTFYAQRPYGSVPAVGWTKPTNAGKQNWQNNDGESHN